MHIYTHVHTHIHTYIYTYICICIPERPPKIAPLSHYLRNQARKLLGHVIRAAPSDPLRQASFSGPHLRLTHLRKKRVGRPRNNWILHNLAAAWATLHNGLPSDYKHTRAQQEYLINAFTTRAI